MKIPPKAYFNNKKLIDVYLEPDTEEIGDWAYAKGTNLREVRIPAGCRISARAFEDCPALESVVVYGTDLSGTGATEVAGTDEVSQSGSNRLSHLLGLAIRNWPDMADLLVQNTADRDAIFEVIDSRLPLYLAEPDDAGFMPFLAGGEEDYDDAEAAREEYIHDRRVNKVLLVYERMRISESCDAMPSAYIDYLRRHNPEITFAILMSSDPHVSDYRTMYFELGLNNPGEADLQTSFTQTLLDMSSRDAELRAMVLTRASLSCDVFDSAL